MGKITLNREPILLPKFDSFPYQHDAVIALRDLEYGAIFHEQGLGKTKIAIDIFLYWLKEKSLDTVLIIAKKSLINNWENELETHCSVKPRVLTQNGVANFYILNSPTRLILTNYEVIKSEKERIKLFLKTRDVGIVLDEAAKIKNPKSDITQTFFELAPLFKKRLILTGTPVANRPYDVWALIWFLDQGKSLGNNFSEFVKDYDLTNELCHDPESQKRFEQNMENIFSKISSFTVRQTKKSGVISLPEKIIESVFCDWESWQRDMYDRIKDEMRLVIVKNGYPQEDISDSILKRLLRLVQVASNPKLVDSSYSAMPGKLGTLKELLVKNDIKNEKTIIWTNFNENVIWLEKELREYEPCAIFGKLPIEQRNNNIERFKKENTSRILIATPGSAKEGLTLTVANNAIFFDRGFSLDDYLQAQDRVHRISQKRTCYIYNLIMKDSIDEWVDSILVAKNLAAQLTQHDIGIDDYHKKMSYDYSQLLNQILE